MAGFNESGGLLSGLAAVRPLRRLGRRHGLTLGLCTLWVLLWHGVLLQGVGWRSVVPAGRPAAAPVLQVRSVVAEAALSSPSAAVVQLAVPEDQAPASARPSPTPTLTAPAPPQGDAARPVSRQRPRHAAPSVARPTTSFAVAADASAEAEVPKPAAPVESRPTALHAASSANVPTEAPDPGASLARGGDPDPDPDRALPWPVYRTRIPPGTLLRYAARRGTSTGEAELQWAPDGDRYQARLSTAWANEAAWVQVSQGGFDDAGLAPQRMTEQRRRAGVAAVNFQRDKGRISFSGPGTAYPLRAGSQDRLSWIVQLVAVAGAEPQRLEPGGQVAIHVSGARGDSRLWVFQSLGVQALDTPEGVLQALHLRRDAEGPYDSRVDVWLDPQRQHWPAKLRLHHGRDDQALELRLLSLDTWP